MMEFEFCPVCDSDGIIIEEKKKTFTYKGRKRSYPLKVYSCPVCGESFYDKNTRKWLEKELTDSRRLIDGLLTSEEIKRIRHKLGLTQVRLAEILGVGKKNFARYETGRATQSRLMDKVLRSLDKIPELIEVLAEDKELAPSELGDWVTIAEVDTIVIQEVQSGEAAVVSDSFSVEHRKSSWNASIDSPKQELKGKGILANAA